MLEILWDSRVNCIAVILFAVGFATLLLHRNLFKKILGLNIMDTASCLLLTSMGYIEGRSAPSLWTASPTYHATSIPCPPDWC